MTSVSSRAGAYLAAADDLSSRQWALRRIHGWLSDVDRAPLLLITGDPGSGKSKLLLSLFAELHAEDGAAIGSNRVVGAVFRDAQLSDPFDELALLRDIAEGLTTFGLMPTADEFLPVEPSAAPIEVENISQTVGSASVVAGVVLQLSQSSGLLPVVRRAVSQVPASERILVIVDALDQAEDEGAHGFIDALSSLVDLARGTGFRFLCTTRGGLPLGFDPRLCETFDLLRDDPDRGEYSDLRDHVESKVGALPPEDARRVSEAILRGAEGNWLWASTNLDATLIDIEREGLPPSALTFSPGLSGLYSDGVRRIMRRIGEDSWKANARALVAVVAASFDQAIGIVELRWVTGLDGSLIEDLSAECAPFVQRSSDGLRVFHPDFGRWFTGGNVAGVSEGAAHLRLARGLTAWGTSVGWRDPDSYAAKHALDHWCLALLLDPNDPLHSTYESELETLLADEVWLACARPTIDALTQVGLIVPTMTLPSSKIPLAAGLAQLVRAEVVELVVTVELYSRSESSTRDLDAILDENAGGSLDAVVAALDQFSGRRDLGGQIVWGALLRGELDIERVSGLLRVRLRPTALPRILRNADLDRANLGSTIRRSIDASEYGDAYEIVERHLATLSEGHPDRPTYMNVLGHLADVMAAAADGGTESLDRPPAVDLFDAAYEAATVGATGRLALAIDLANALWILPSRSADQLDQLIEVQAEIRDLRRAADDSQWPTAAVLLGRALRERAAANDDEVTDLRAAVAAYREAVEATPMDHERRLDYTIALANALLALPERSDEELDLLIEAQSEIRDGRRATWDDDLATAANLLGRALWERAARQDDGTEDLRAATDAFLVALAATPEDHERRLDYTIGLANALLSLPERSDEELDLWIVVQREVLDRRRTAGDDEADVATAASLLGDALRERAERRSASGSDGDGRRAVVEAYREALARIPVDHERRLDYAVDLVNALLALPERSDDDLDLWIEVQAEIRDRRQAADDARWPTSASLLGDALRERAARRDDGVEDLRAAIVAYRETLAATPVDDEGRLACAVDLANALLALPERTDVELDRWIELQTEIRDRRRAADDAGWPVSASLLGDALRERAARQEDGDEELRLAIENYREAFEATPTDDERWVLHAIDLADALMALPERTDDELDLWIEVQGEIPVRRRAAGDANWPISARLLGDALRERAARQDDGDEDLRAAIGVYREAWAATPTDHGRRIVHAIDLANALLALSERSDDELDLWIDVQTEIRDRRKAADDANWPTAMSLLGDALRERAERQDDGVEDLRAAMRAYREALRATPVDHERRLTYVIDLANGLLRLPERTDEELDLLIEVQTELRDRRKAAAHEYWPTAANLLGRALRERASRQADGVDDLRAAIAAHREALAAAPQDHEDRLDYAVDLVNALRALPGSTDDELDLWIEVQTEIRDRRKAAEDANWPTSASLLGDVLRERATRQESGRSSVEDLRGALALYREAFDATEPGDERRPVFAVDLANAEVTLAAIARTGGPEALERAVQVMATVLAERYEDYSPLRGLMPVIATTLRRRSLWPS